MSDELTEDESRQLREAVAKAIPAAKAAIRKQVAAIEKALRDGTLEELVQQWRGKCDQPPVMHVTDVDSDTGDVESFKLCEEHAREYDDSLPPTTPPP